MREGLLKRGADRSDHHLAAASLGLEAGILARSCLLKLVTFTNPARFDLAIAGHYSG